MFGGGGGGMNPRKMQQMMKQMGIDVDELDVEEVIIRTADEELYFSDAQVTKMDARGQETYQVVGSPDSREVGSGDASAIESGDGDAAAGAVDSDGGDGGIPDDDVELVAMRAGVPEDQAREALEANDGDLAAAVSALEE
ncbi:nascent polypeptide-associated complex protein [Halorubellus sp. JP-L1]|uniref:nascent polypeptide-associated complex protein n=1 Tax=Halorubellus sp. JP-L1 TaxID=2715753 RepID=UPI001F035C53|nr:nascent polypeptide-associated complex protein [Halorubellus sp. JP-L1]